MVATSLVILLSSAVATASDVSWFDQLVDIDVDRHNCLRLRDFRESSVELGHGIYGWSKGRARDGETLRKVMLQEVGITL